MIAAVDERAREQALACMRQMMKAERRLKWLVEALRQVYYGASCETRKDGVRRVDLAPLVSQLGPGTLLRDVRAHLRCARCGGRQIITVKLWKDGTSSDSMVAGLK